MSSFNESLKHELHYFNYLRECAFGETFEQWTERKRRESPPQSEAAPELPSGGVRSVRPEPLRNPRQEVRSEGFYRPFEALGKANEDREAQHHVPKGLEVDNKIRAGALREPAWGSDE